MIPNGPRGKILLVEDSKLLRLSSQRALVNAGYDVVAVADGEAALHAARENIPDLILLDMILPKITGLDVLRSLKSDKRTAHVPVVVLSGLSQANEAKLRSEGAAAFFEKSEKHLENDAAALVQAVNSMLIEAKK
jgi:CheY-like chemotaxis protein